MVVRIVVFILGAALVAGAVLSAVRSFVLPRSAQDGIARIVFVVTRHFFDLLTSRLRTFPERDRLMAFYAPFSLLLLLPAWLILVLAGYAGMYWATGIHRWQDALTVSGSSLLTLGFAPATGIAGGALEFSEATLGLMLVALLIGYLPTIYSAFARRETAVAMLEVRAGSPPSALEMIKRYYRIHGLDALGHVWASWEVWFSDIEESHTSLGVLALLRSQQPTRSWVTASGAVLDAASLTNALLDVPHDPQADLCIRAGFIALRRIADFFQIPYNPDPHAGDPISIERAEFDAACEDLAQAGVPLKPDQEQAWRDFSGWRVNYDTVLLALADLTMAPYAAWSSDRSRPDRRSWFKKT